MSYPAAARALQRARSVIVTTHVNPDGDGIGTGLALMHALARLGKRVRLLCPSRVAGIYGFLPGADRIRPVPDAARARRLPGCDVMVSCDCGDRERLGAVARVPHRCLINLDHHATNTRFGDINLVDEQGECSGVVAERLLRRLRVRLDRAAAACLYATVVYDTGRFMHANTTAHTFRWAARLLDTGIDAAAINRALTYTRSRHDLRLLALGLDRLRVDVRDARLAGIELSARDIARVGAPEDWGDLVDVPRSLAGNQVAYLMREAPDRKSVRLSLRANPPFAVAPVAQAFGGGGHRQAAGCTVPGNLASARRAVLPRLRRQLAIGGKDR